MNDDLINQIIGNEDDEFEAEVKKYLSLVGDVRFNQIKHKRAEIPTFASQEEERLWWDEQRDRCINGYAGMTGKHYFYFNFCYIKGAGSGRIRPEWRRVDSEYFELVESCLRGENQGKGIIIVKRRRVGASWKIVSDMLHECIFYPYSELGLQSKTDDDVKILFNNKLKFVYDNLPTALKPSSDAGNSLKKIEFAKNIKDSQGNRKKVGTHSIITCKSPEDSNWEGMGLKYWIADEAGKTKNLKSILTLTLPCLAGDDGFTRVGVPMLCGTVGDIDTVGNDIKKIWEDNETYDLIRYFIPGWAGLNLDDNGNEDIEANIRWILKERKKREHLSQKEYYDFMQQYPLTIEEAFMYGSDSPFDLVSINVELSEHEREPYKWQTGYFEMAVNSDGREEVIFQPSKDPKRSLVRILEHPEEHRGDIYVAGSDPYDHDKTHDEGSDASFFIRKGVVEPTAEDIENGYTSQLIVCEYTDNPKNPNVFYEQCLYACMYYDCQVLIERNRIRMISYFTDRGYQKYLRHRPGKANKLSRPTVSSLTEYGVFMDEDTKRQMIGLIDNEIRNNPKCFTSKELLEDMLVYNPDKQKKKYDRVDAFGITLIHAREKSIRPVKKVSPENLPKWKYVNKGGKMTRVSS